MATHTTINDFQPALERVQKLLDKYEPKHQGAWKTQTLITHANHGRIHAQAAEQDALNSSVLRIHPKDWSAAKEENLASNACRALMLLTRFLELKEAQQLGKPRESRSLL